MKRTIVVILFAIFAVPFCSIVFAQDTNSDGQVSFLIPVAFSGPQQLLPGAFGTMWAGELWYHNASGIDVQTLQNTGICVPVCPPAYPAGSFGTLDGTETNYNLGAMLHVPASVGTQFRFSARLLELSRNAQPTGVDIPVVAEPDFLTTAGWLLGVPSNGGSRVTLRVYDPRARNDTAIEADFIDRDGATITSTVLYPTGNVRFYGNLAMSARVASINDLTAAIPELRAHDVFHVRVRPLQSGREYWAMISVTDNDTQTVLLITPQSY